MKMLTADELRALIAQGEGVHVELKGSGARPIELAERICGLANSAGGWVIMGVDDATLEIIGVNSPKYARDNLIQAARRCQPQLLFSPPEPQSVAIDGKRLVVAYVPQATDTLYQTTGGTFWIRKGSQTVPMTLPELVSAMYHRGLRSWEREPSPLPASLEDLSSDLLATFMASRSPALLRHSNDSQRLVGLGAAVDVSGRGLVPTNVGLLMFSELPQALLLQSEVDVVEWRVPGTPSGMAQGGAGTGGAAPGMAAGEAGRGGWLDRRRLTGPVPELIEGALHFVQTHIRVSARIVGSQRIETAAYPLEAVREAIVNALVHRDYSIAGSNVRVFIYHDHLEVRSPGRLLPGVSIEALLQGEAISRARNPVLASLLRDWPGGHYIERLGAGVRLMMTAMQEEGLPPPILEEVGDEFVVRFISTSAEAGSTFTGVATMPAEIQATSAGAPAVPLLLPQVR
ncbi:MAG: ATP-binding protein [Chloroflexota bacterium]